jgi:hypothetical protein
MPNDVGLLGSPTIGLLNMRHVSEQWRKSDDGGQLHASAARSPSRSPGELLTQGGQADTVCCQISGISIGQQQQCRRPAHRHAARHPLVRLRPNGVGPPSNRSRKKLRDTTHARCRWWACLTCRASGKSPPAVHTQHALMACIWFLLGDDASAQPKISDLSSNLQVTD